MPGTRVPRKKNGYLGTGASKIGIARRVGLGLGSKIWRGPVSGGHPQGPPTSSGMYPGTCH